MKSTFITGSLLLGLLSLFLVACGSDSTGSSAEPTLDSSTTESTTASDETSVTAASSATEETTAPVASAASCEPTPPDMLGPFYEPDAPARTSVGSGYVTSGSVLAAESCEPISGAQIEFWLANPEGNYDDAHRATVLAGEQGEYRFESNVPVPYENRPPHLHARVTAPGYEELVTQHYPQPGQTEATFDLVLVPA